LVKFLDFDSSRRLVFFHTRDGQVGRLRLDRPAAPAEILMRDAVLDAIAYDWTRGLLFYLVPDAADARNNSGGVGVLNAHLPKGPGCGPGQGLLYISLWCAPGPACTPCAMDGSELRPLLTGGRGAPGRLALDSEQGRLYWLDMELRGVFSAGSTARTGGPSGTWAAATTASRWAWRSSRTAAALERDLRRPAPFTPSTNSRGQPLKLVLPPEHSGSVLSAVVYHSCGRRWEVRRAAGGARCGGHICIQAGGSPVCLCDQLSVMKDGVCVPSGDAGRKPGRKQPEPVAAESTGAAQDGSDAAAGQQQSLVAAARSKLTAHEVNPDTEEADQDENPAKPHATSLGHNRSPAITKKLYFKARTDSDEERQALRMEVPQELLAADYVLFYAQIHSFPEDNQLQCRLKVAARQLYWAPPAKWTCRSTSSSCSCPLPRTRRSGRSGRPTSPPTGASAPRMLTFCCTRAEFVKMEMPLKANNNLSFDHIWILKNPLPLPSRRLDRNTPACGCPDDEAQDRGDNPAAAAACSPGDHAIGEAEEAAITDENRRPSNPPQRTSSVRRSSSRKKHMFFGGGRDRSEFRPHPELSESTCEIDIGLRAWRKAVARIAELLAVLRPAHVLQGLKNLAWNKEDSIRLVRSRLGALAGAPLGRRRFLPTLPPCTTPDVGTGEAPPTAGCGCRTAACVVEDADKRNPTTGGGDSRDGWRLNSGPGGYAAEPLAGTAASSLSSSAPHPAVTWRRLAFYYGVRLHHTVLLFLTAIGLCFFVTDWPMREWTGTSLGLRSTRSDSLGTALETPGDQQWKLT
uniref:Low-density lipoprotein receptor-related protein 5 n=1 Tax=Macrostomum lignano TaxID=282301 RepID=A0A1I8JQK7_9PLAT